MEKVTPMETEFDVRFYETDGLGHVGNTVHVGWLEAARDPLFRIFSPELSLSEWPLILASYKVDFLAQIYYGSSVTIKTWVGRLGRSSFDVYQEIWQNDTHCATGNTTMVYFNYAKQKAETIPDTIREKVKPYIREV
ncbi:thioesterase family protein [Alteromonas sp. 14N.309.X.WAT.G.H12]|uniref:acyl-CoA thioesterase n=1 Tax=Alteromonas sp. 14N.309.X.WAT.G.H12 TaxID=3120824 RepID=UPI002FCF05BD